MSSFYGRRGSKDVPPSVDWDRVLRSRPPDLTRPILIFLGLVVLSQFRVRDMFTVSQASTILVCGEHASSIPSRKSASRRMRGMWRISACTASHISRPGGGLGGSSRTSSVGSPK